MDPNYKRVSFSGSKARLLQETLWGAQPPPPPPTHNIKNKTEQNADACLAFSSPPSLFDCRKTVCDLNQIQSQVTPHAIVFLPSSDGMEMLLCYEDEGVYVNTYGRIIKDVVLQWGEMPTSVGTTPFHGRKRYGNVGNKYISTSRFSHSSHLLQSDHGMGREGH